VVRGPQVGKHWSSVLFIHLFLCEKRILCLKLSIKSTVFFTNENLFHNITTTAAATATTTATEIQIWGTAMNEGQMHEVEEADVQVLVDILCCDTTRKQFLINNEPGTLSPRFNGPLYNGLRRYRIQSAAADGCAVVVEPTPSLHSVVSGIGYSPLGPTADRLLRNQHLVSTLLLAVSDTVRWGLRLSGCCGTNTYRPLCCLMLREVLIIVG
jgi:hypothetical protein